MVHDLAEHITDHTLKCKVFLKDTKDQDLQEVSKHLIEIDSKVHELADNVQFLEDKLIDEYERLGFDIELPDKEGK